MTLLPTAVRVLALAVAVALGAAAVPAPAREPDRLDRFRALAATRLSLAELVGPDGAGGTPGPAEPYRDAYALLDEEIVDSLASGGVFASPAFLQDRLDAFAEAWGAAVLRVTRVGPLLVGGFSLSGRAGSGNSVRVYGRLGQEAALLAAFDRGGRPGVHVMPPARGGAPQFLVTWEGAPTGRGTRAVRLDLVRQHGEGVRTVWSTADLFPEGLQVRGHHVRDATVTLRYEARYPGWTPGCEGQTEVEETYRLAPGGEAFVRAQRREHNAWHRAVHSAAAAVFAALAEGDARALARVVPDPRLRERLPATLRPEPACDAVEGPEAVSVAASAGEREPWNLTFRRAGSGWRLTAATRVQP